MTVKETLPIARVLSGSLLLGERFDDYCALEGGNACWKLSNWGEHLGVRVPRTVGTKLKTRVVDVSGSLMLVFMKF